MRRPLGLADRDPSRRRPSRSGSRGLGTDARHGARAGRRRVGVGDGRGGEHAALAEQERVQQDHDEDDDRRDDEARSTRPRLTWTAISDGVGRVPAAVAAPSPTLGSGDRRSAARRGGGRFAADLGDGGLVVVDLGLVRVDRLRARPASARAARPAGSSVDVVSSSAAHLVGVVVGVGSARSSASRRLGVDVVGRVGRSGSSGSSGARSSSGRFGRCRRSWRRSTRAVGSGAARAVRPIAGGHASRTAGTNQPPHRPAVTSRRRR